MADQSYFENPGGLFISCEGALCFYNVFWSSASLVCLPVLMLYQHFSGNAGKHSLDTRKLQSFGANRALPSESKEEHRQKQTRATSCAGFVSGSGETGSHHKALWSVLPVVLEEHPQCPWAEQHAQCIRGSTGSRWKRSQSHRDAAAVTGVIFSVAVK